MKDVKESKKPEKEPEYKRNADTIIVDDILLTTSIKCESGERIKLNGFDTTQVATLVPLLAKMSDDDLSSLFEYDVF